MMKNFILILIILLGTIDAYGQAMTFEEATISGKNFDYLDKVYKSAVHANPDLAVFKTKQQQQDLQKAYSTFLQNLGSFLKANNFFWNKQTRCFNRIYFNNDGTVQYFLYHFTPGDVDATTELEFGRLLNIFIRDQKIPISANEKFAQCSPVKYSD